MSFGNQLKRLRELRNLSLDEVSQILEIGRSTLWEYEHDITRPSLDKYFKILHFYHVPERYTFDDDREIVDLTDFPLHIKNKIYAIMMDYEIHHK